jgi:hypothetical protein
LIKFEQVLGLIQNTANKNGGTLYLRHGVTESLVNLRKALPGMTIVIYTNYSRSLFTKVIWPGLKYDITAPDTSTKKEGENFLVDSVFFIAPG